MSVATLEAAPRQARAVNFADAFLEMKLVRRRWDGVRQLNAADVVFADEKVDKSKVKAPQVKLLPKVWNKQFSKVYSRLDSVLAIYTLPFDQIGKRIVPRQAADKFAAALLEIKVELAGLVDRFAETYDVDVVEAARDYWRPRFVDDKAYDAAIGALIPAKSELHARFSIEHSVYEPTAALASRVDVKEAELRGFYEESRANAQRDVEEMIAHVVTGPREQFAASLAKIAEQLNNKEAKIVPGSFTTLRDSIDLCLAFSATADDAFTGGLRSLRTKVDDAVSQAETVYKAGGAGFGVTLRQYSSTLNQAFAEISKLCNDEQAQAEALRRFGVAPRHIR